MKQIAVVGLVVVAVIFASVGPSQARPNVGHGSAGGHAVARVENHRGFQIPSGFQGRQGVDGRRELLRGDRGRGFVGVGPLFAGRAFAYGGFYDPGPVYSPPVYSAPAPPTYWYCPSAGAYYPDVPSCPDPWVPVQWS